MKKYHLIKWTKVCKDKKKGGLGVKELRNLNVRLMCKWWWLLEHENGMWQEIVALKYVRGTPVCLIKPKISDSLVWTDLLKTRQVYLKGREYILNNGKLISFWLDVWMGKDPLCVTYPILYDLYLEKTSL
jgi:hypothetical protein